MGNNCCQVTNKVGNGIEETEKKESFAGDNKSLDDATDEWKTLITQLIANKELKAYAQAKPRTHLKTVKDLGDYLSKCPYARNETEKAWLVFLWITENITYDVDTFQKRAMAKSTNQKIDLQSCLTSGMGISLAYAELFAYLITQVAQIESMSTNGYSKGFNYKIGSKLVREDHRWNVIRLPSGDGVVYKWHYVDVTWAAGYVTRDFKFVKDFNPYYFATPPHIFNETHYSSAFSLGNGPNSLGEFEEAQLNTIDFHLCGLKCLNYQNYSEIR